MLKPPAETPESEEPSPLDRLSGRLLVFAAGLLWSTNGFFAKAPFFNAWPLGVVGLWDLELPVRGPVLAFWRAIFATLVLLPFVRNPRWHPLLVPLTLVFAVMNFTFLAAMSYTTAANAIWLQNTGPVWVFLIGVFFLGEKVDMSDWAMLGLNALGVGLILTFELQSGVGSMAGVIYALLSGITYAAVVLHIRVLRTEDSAWLIMLNHLVTAILFAPYVVWQSQSHALWPTGWQWPTLIAFGVLQMGTPYLLFARGLKSIPGHEASGIGLVEPLLVPLWVWLAWSSDPTYESPRWWTFVGGGCILVGLIVKFIAGSLATEGAEQKLNDDGIPRLE